MKFRRWIAVWHVIVASNFTTTADTHSLRQSMVVFNLNSNYFILHLTLIHQSVFYPSLSPLSGFCAIEFFSFCFKVNFTLFLILTFSRFSGVYCVVHIWQFLDGGNCKSSKCIILALTKPVVPPWIFTKGFHWISRTNFAEAKESSFEN